MIVGAAADHPCEHSESELEIRGKRLVEGIHQKVAADLNLGDARRFDVGLVGAGSAERDDIDRDAILFEKKTGAVEKCGNIAAQPSGLVGVRHFLQVAFIAHQTADPEPRVASLPCKGERLLRGSAAPSKSHFEIDDDVDVWLGVAG